MTCLPRTRAERTGLTVSIQHACLKILSVDQITLLCVFHQKWTLHRMLDPACRGFALPVKKGAHSCGDRCVKTGCHSVARPDGYRSKTVSCRECLSVAGKGSGATHPAPREACCLSGAGRRPSPALPSIFLTKKVKKIKKNYEMYFFM